MKALSLWEPWATLMAIGAKKIETRSWMTRYTGPLLICAAARCNKGELRVLFEIEEFMATLRDEPLSFGKAVAVVHLDGCAEVRQIGSISKQERAFGDYCSGRFAWLTSGLHRIPEPFPVKGSQGLFNVAVGETGL